MNKKIIHHLCILLTVVMVAGILPLTASAEIRTDLDGVIRFTTFADLQQLVSREYELRTRIAYVGDEVGDPLVIESDLVLPENFELNTSWGEIVIPAGVCVTASQGSGIYCDDITVAGTLQLMFLSNTNIRESLTVTGRLQCEGFMALMSSDVQLIGAENISVVDYGEVSIRHIIWRESDLLNACAVAASDTRPGFNHDFDLQGPLTIQEHIVIPANGTLLLGGACTVATDATLECLGGLSVYTEPLVVYGTLINNCEEIQIAPQQGGTLEIAAGGTYAGEGGFYVSHGDASSAIIGIDMTNYNAATHDGESWHYDYIGTQPTEPPATEPPVELPTITGTYTTDLVMSAADLGVSAPDSVLRATLTFGENGTASCTWEAVDLTAFRIFFHDMFVNAYYAMAYGAGITDINEIEQFCVDSTGMSVSAYMDTLVTEDAMREAFTPAPTGGTYSYNGNHSAIYTDLAIMGVESAPAVADSFVIGENTLYLNAASYGKADYTFVCTRR